MICYASRTGTKRNLDLLRRCGWRLLVSATGVWRTEGFQYAIDNGAWTAFKNGTAFNADLFMRLVEKLGEGADWIVIPDIVEGGLKSLEFSLSWIPRLRGVAPLLLPVQDGMEPGYLEGVIGREIGVFIGGSDGFKERADKWGKLAKERGCHLHMGRVNSARRIKIARAVGCHSIDGSSASRFAVTTWKLTSAARQEPIDLEFSAG